jgi:hypothetical protein
MTQTENIDEWWNRVGRRVDNQRMAETAGAASMIQDPRAQQIALSMRTRDQAEGLLNRLIAERGAAEQRLAEHGRHDPIKDLTGASAFDRAIETTRRMISHMDDLLIELTGEVDGLSRVVQVPYVNGHGSGRRSSVLETSAAR